MDMVFDSSTLILLAKIEILRDVSEEFRMIIPPMVKDECLVRDSFDSKLISFLIGKGNIEIQRTVKREMVRNLCRDFTIHAGEAEALALAMQRNVPLAVDDLPAIKACKILNRPFTTAIHFLLILAASGKISPAIALVKLEKLSYYGRYSKQIIDNAYSKLKGGL